MRSGKNNNAQTIKKRIGRSKGYKLALRLKILDTLVPNVHMIRWRISEPHYSPFWKRIFPAEAVFRWSKSGVHLVVIIKYAIVDRSNTEYSSPSS